MPTIQETARQLYDAFETKTRANGDSFVSLKDGSPDWMADACHTAHGDMFPDDWRYRAIQDAAEHIANSDDPEDDRHEFADSVDVYTSELHKWLSSNGYRSGYVDAAHEEMGMERGDIDAQLMLGQYHERDEVFGLLLAALETEMEDEDEDETETETEDA